MTFAFTPSDGYRNTVSFPTKPANETAFRDSMQTLLDQVAAELNAGTNSAAGIASRGRQAIINGNFDIWQRGTSVSYSGNFGAENAAGYGPDRWWSQVYAGSSGSATNSFTFQQQAFTLGQTDVPNEPKYFGRVNVSSLGTKGGGNAIIRIKQNIESVRTFAGQKCTVSFYAKADSARTCGIALGQYFGTGGSPSTEVACGGTTISLTTAWQKFTYTFTVPSISGKTIGTNNDDALNLYIIPYKEDNSIIALPSGSVGTFATGLFDIAQVQVNAGDTALPFQPRSFGEELALCQRYYEKSYAYTDVPGSNTGVNLHMTTSLTANVASGNRWFIGSHPKFTVEKRVTPTVQVYTSAGTLGSWTIGAVIRATSVNPFTKGFFLLNNTGALATVNADESFGHWIADAEL